MTVFPVQTRTWFSPIRYFQVAKWRRGIKMDPVISRFEIEHIAVADISAQDEAGRFTQQWAHEEGWNLLPSDLIAFRQLDPAGWITGRLNGQIITAILALNMSERHCFIATFITAPEHRGKGFGKVVLEEALKHAESRNIGLFAAERAAGFYEKYGFVAYGKDKVYRINTSLNRFRVAESPYITDVKEVPIKSLADFDGKYSKCRREDFVQTWISLGERKGYAYVEQGRVRGYGVIRKCGDPPDLAKIGPLFAENRTIAQELLLALLPSLNDVREVIFETYERNTEAEKLAQEFGVYDECSYVEMYTKGLPDFDVGGVYAYTSPATG